MSPLMFYEPYQADTPKITEHPLVANRQILPMPRNAHVAEIHLV